MLHARHDAPPEHGAMIRVRTLGQCTIQIDSTPVGPDAEIVFAALLLLTAQPGRRFGRSELLGMLWPGTTESRAAHCLRQTIYRLRTLGVPLEVSRASISVAPDVVDSDVDALLHLRRPEATERLADSVDGPFLPGYSPNFSEPLREWVERQRDLVTAAARRVFVGAIATRKSRAEWGDVERLAHRCLAIDPLNEDATLALAEAAALHGGKVEAIGILDRYLREMGPSARELRLPAMALRRRISEPELEFPLAPPLHVPFVGRSAEMASLAAALRAARGGAGSVHFIHGEPGIGKTRLLNEFSRAASLEGARVAAAVCQSSDARRPLSAFVDLVPRLMTMPGALGCSPQSHKYLRRLLEQYSSESPPTPDSAEAAMLYAGVRGALFDLIDAIASEAVLVVTIEDVQWLDSASWEIIAESSHWLQARRVLLILTSRERERQSSQSRASPLRNISSMGLAPLTRSEAESLFAATVGQPPHEITQAFRDWCVAMSGGNPYYLSELALHGLQRQGEFAVPPSLSALMGERVARLRPVSCRVLQACAILGRDATVDRIERTLAQRRIELLDALDELDEQALVGWSGCHIVSRHDLLSQAAVARLSPLSRRLLHQHAALVLEAELPLGGSTALVWSSIEHWAQAGAPERGVALVCKCARQAIELGQPQEAVELLRRTKDLSLASEARLSVLTELIYAYRAADRWYDATQAFADLRSLRENCSAECTHDDIELIGIESQWLGGFAPEVILSQLLQCCRSGQATPSHRVAAAKLCLIISDNTRDRATATEAYRLVAHDLHCEALPTLEGLEARLIFETSFGDRTAAKAAVDRLLEAEWQSPRRQAFTLILVAHACERLGMLQRVSEVAAEAYRLGVECSCTTAAAAAARKLAWAYLDDADLGQAEHWYQLAMAWAEKGQLSSFVADLRGLEAELLIARQDYAGADEALVRSRAAWNRTIHARWKLGVLSAQCAIWLATGDRQKCVAAISEYSELLTPLYKEEGNDLFATRYFLLIDSVAGRDQADAELRKYVASRSKSADQYSPALKAVLQKFSAEASDAAITRFRPSEVVLVSPSPPSC
jgi:DNA-binding SARP family transcriptional activator